MYYFNIIFEATGSVSKANPSTDQPKCSRGCDNYNEAVSHDRPLKAESAPINIEAQKCAKPYRRFTESLERTGLGGTACEPGGDQAGGELGGAQRSE